MKTAQLALQTFPSLKNITVLIYTDNTTSLLYINKQGDPLSTSDGTSNGNMELVSTIQHLYTGSTCSRNSQQDCRYGIPMHVHQEPMSNQAASIPMDRQDLGTSQCGPIRRPHCASPTKVCLVASGSWHYPHGCVYDELDQTEESVHQPPLGI